jgi:hypothetical protein
MYRKRIYHLTGLIVVLIVLQFLFSNDTANARPGCISCPWCTRAVYGPIAPYKNGTWVLVDTQTQVKLSNEVMANFKHFFQKQKVKKDDVKELVGLIVLSVHEDKMGKDKMPVVIAFVPGNFKDPTKFLNTKNAPSAQENLEISKRDLELEYNKK